MVEIMYTSSEQVNQKSTADILGILERVDERLASLEQNMGPIRRVRIGV